MVIMMGRKRRRQALWMASHGVRCFVALCLRSAKSIIMMAFFFTMPIKSTMPMSAMTVKSRAAHEQREERADAGGGQGREDRDRVDGSSRRVRRARCRR